MANLSLPSAWRGVLVAAGLALAGCATLAPAPNLAVSVTNVLPRESTLLETSVDLTLRLTNESSQPLAFAGSSHRVYVNDTYVGRAVSSERCTVPALGTATPTVTVFLENLSLLAKAREFAAAPKLAYRLESRFHPADGAGWGDVKTVATGELDLRGLGIAPPPVR